VTGAPQEPIWLPRAAVEAAHADQIRTHGGQLGLRDQGLLDSALSRPRYRWLYEDGSDIAELAASYGFGLVKNHPFVDGNKRIAFIAANMFLIVNGYEIQAPEPAVVLAMMQAADGSLGEPELAAWIRSVLIPLDDPSLFARGGP
jgi:death on curing protein